MEARQELHVWPTNSGSGPTAANEEEEAAAAPSEAERKGSERRGGEWRGGE